MTSPSPTDPVLVARARASRFAELGQRAGYALFGLALLVYFVGLFGTFSSLVSNVIIGCVVVGSLILAPAIVMGYAVKAAIRDDVEHGRDLS